MSSQNIKCIKGVLILILFAAIATQVNALGIVSDYLKDNTLVLTRGESITYGIRLQNPSSNEIRVSLDFDREFLEVRDYRKEYPIPPMSSRSIVFEVKAPKTKNYGIYNAAYNIKQIGGAGISLQLGNTIKIEVQKSLKDEIRKRNALIVSSLAFLILLILALKLLKRKKNIYEKLAFYSDWTFKIGMLLFGIVSLFGYFDFTGKMLGAFMLFLLWLGFEPYRFIFGTASKKMDYALLISFYIFALDVFTRIIQTTNYNPATLKTITFYLSVLPEPLYKFIIDSSLFVYNSDSAISLFSATVGFILIVLTSIISSISHKYEKESMVYPVISLFNKNDDFWEKFAQRGLNRYTSIKVFASLAVVIVFSHYFFNLVNQWFIVTIGNSTFIIAFFLSIKDIKNTGIKVLDKIGGFDEELILITKRIFNSRKYFIFGFSILLTFHFMSDTTLFMLPYFITAADLDEYYSSVLNQGPHLNFVDLFSSESISSQVEKAYYLIVYISSALGMLFLFMIPIILLFLFILQKDLKGYLEKKHHRVLLYGAFITSTIFLLAPWTEVLPIIKDSMGRFVNVQGVDFITTRISDSGYSLIFVFTLLIILLGLTVIFFNNKKVQEYALTITFIYSLIFLGKYIWNFYLSTFFYYFNVLKFLIASKNFLLIPLFSFLSIIETLFYIGGFFVLGYYTSRYIITQKTKNIMSEKAIFTYTALFFLVPAILLYRETLYAITSTSVAIASLFIFSFALYKEFKKEEHRDDYILGVSIVIAIFQITVVTSFYAKNLSLMNLLYLLTFSQPAIGLAISYVSLKLFKIKLKFGPVINSLILRSIFFGLAFGAVFYLITEPSASTINMPINILLVYLAIIAVSEEILFRGILLNLADRAFSFDIAVLLQSLVFSSAHFISINSIFVHYGSLSSSVITTVLYVSVYYVLLYSFAMVAGFLYGREDRNIIYPIIFHFTTNLTLFLMR